MKRLVFTILVVAAICSIAQAKYSGGSGTTGDPYKIATKADLLALAATINDYNQCFILTADIDMGGQVFTKAIIAADSISGHTFQGTSFKGTFDGNDHKITNFTIDDGNNYYLGLFGYIDHPGLIKNLGLENFTVSGYGSVGGLVGYSHGGSISNCYSTGTVSGLIRVGGLVGDDYGTISNCYSISTVTGIGMLGGLAGSSYFNTSNCYSSGVVNGTYDVGGLVGYNCGGNISNCYSTGMVSGTSNVGGLVGYYTGGTISLCYFLNTSGPSNGYGTPLTDSQMKHQSSFFGWNFTSIWRMRCEGINYPKLNWQAIPAADLVCPDGVNFVDYSFFAEHWMNTNCAVGNNCDGTDFDFSGTVDIADLKIFCNYWLQGL